MNISRAKKEFLKGAAYAAITNMACVKEGYITFEEAKKTVLKWMNFGLPEGEIWDMTEYFNPKVSGFKLNEQMRNYFSKEAREALKFFFPVSDLVKTSSFLDWKDICGGI